MRECAVRLRGVQPRRWLHVPGAAADGTELCGWYGPGSAARHGSVVRCRAEFWRQSCYSLLGVSERRVFLEVSQTVTPFECSAVQTGLLLFWFLPFCLFCHWRVGRVGRRGLLTQSRLLELRKGRFAGETEIAGARESAALVLSGEQSRGGSCGVCGCPHNLLKKFRKL